MRRKRGFVERSVAHPWWLLAAVMLGDGAFVVLQVPSPSFGAFGLTPFPLLIAETLTYLVGGYLAYRFRARSSRALYFICAAACALAMVALASGMLPNSLVMPLQTVVYIALALLNLCWGVCFASFIPAVSTVLVAGAYLLWSTFSLLISLSTGTDAGTAMQAVLPVASVLLLGCCLAKLDFSMNAVEAPRSNAPARLSSFTKVSLVGSFAFSFLFGTMMQIDALMASEQFITSPEVQIGIIAISLAVLLYAIKAKPSSSVVVMIIVPIVLATVLMGRSLVTDQSFFTSGFPAVLFNFFGLFVWVVFAWEGHRSPLGGFVIYALGLGTMRLGLLGGRGLAMALSSAGPLSPAVASALSTVSLWILFIGCLAIGLYVLKQQRTEQLLASPNTAASGAAPEHLEDASDLFAARLAAVAEPAGLTSREQEILGLYAQGRSAVYIAEKLVLSNYTVKTHIRRAYAKLDVHSRQDLLDLLQGAQSDEENA